MALLFWAIFLFWQIFPVFVAGFGANFEFRTLLRFPLSRGAFYTIALAYGFADFSALASVCWLLSMMAGATVAKPGVFLVTHCAYYGPMFLLGIFLWRPVCRLGCSAVRRRYWRCLR